MESAKLTRERQFLIRTAVMMFNRQYGKRIKPELCGVKSIRKNYGCTHGYEIKTFQENDQLRLRLYFTLGDRDQFEPYRLEVDQTFVQDALGDEVYVMLGTVSQMYVENDIYRFRPLSEIVNEGNYVLYTDGDFFEFMSGEKMQWVNA